MVANQNVLIALRRVAHTRGADFAEGLALAEVRDGGTDTLGDGGINY